MCYRSKSKEGKTYFVIQCELDSHKWSVLRRETDVQKLHADLSKVTCFMPDSPLAAEKRWAAPLASRRDGMRKRLEDFLRQLTANGQWVWDEYDVLRHFLEMPKMQESHGAHDTEQTRATASASRCTGQRRVARLQIRRLEDKLLAGPTATPIHVRRRLTGAFTSAILASGRPAGC